jgi:hypothetical protein
MGFAPYMAHIDLRRSTRMRILALIFVAALVTACGREPEPFAKPPADAPQGTAEAGPTAHPLADGKTENTPANLGQPQTIEEKKESTEPVQGQVDTKPPAQRQDFQHPQTGGR